MAGFTSVDDMIQKISQTGNFFRTDWNKQFLPTTAATANDWHCLARGGGSPAPDTIMNTGSNLTFQPLYYSSSGSGGIYAGADVDPYYKHLINAGAGTGAATTTPAILYLIDIVGFYRITSLTSTSAQSLTNTFGVTYTFTADAGTDICTHAFYNLMAYTRVQLTTSGTLPAGLTTATDYYVIKVTDTTCKFATSYANAVAGTAINITDAGTGTHNITTLLPRYTSGAGLKSFIYANNATPLGAATPTVTLVYTNEQGTGSRTTPSSPSLPISTSACPNGKIIYSGTGTGKMGPFMPTQQSDAGISKVDSFQLSVSHVSGEVSLVLCKPICSMPLTTLGVLSEREFVNQLPSLPRIYSGANLHWLMNSGAATPVNSSIYGYLEFGWG